MMPWLTKETAEDALAAHAASNDGKIVAAVAREVDNKEKRGANLATSANVVRDAIAAAQEIDQEAQAAASAAKEEVQRSRMVSQAVSADRTWEAQEGLTPSTQQLEEDESGLAGGGRAGEEQDEQDEIPLDFTGAQTFAVDGEDGPHGDTEDVALPREAEDEQRSAGLIFNARRGNRASDQAGNVERKIKSQLQRVRQKIFEERIKEREAARRVSNARFRAARTLSTDTPSQVLDSHDTKCRLFTPRRSLQAQHRKDHRCPRRHPSRRPVRRLSQRPKHRQHQWPWGFGPPEPFFATCNT